MKNLIVVGDSFCSSATEWPKYLADHLNLDLICFGQGGQPWWSVRKFLKNLSHQFIDNADCMVFLHTNAERIPTSNTQVGLIDHSNLTTAELDRAVSLYYRHIHDHEFLNWAQQQWFLEINRLWGNKKLIHLPCFAGTVPHLELLKGLKITTNLMALSLNEIATENFGAFNDQRSNHFNQYNNKILAEQLYNLIKNYKEGTTTLEVTQFDQKTDRWNN